MSMFQNADYTVLDHPKVLSSIFHPRREPYLKWGINKGMEIDIPVEKDVSIGACFHMTDDKNSPSLLFFHGNGEIVADYDDLGTLYRDAGINFLVVDYRGYGRSSGRPTVSAMMGDSHLILAFVKNYLQENGYKGTLSIMGRSLGSAPALELAASPSSSNLFQSLILESGFAFASPLLRVLGVHPEEMGFQEDQGFSHMEKIKKWTGPTLIIHGEFDHIIPFSDGEALFHACPSQNKTLLKINGADHNNIFMVGMDIYMEKIRELLFHT
ncbi:MAG: alpha/beta hydrolase [Desulfamplus sp.]|nr:alpha/beta hydrolase [Desulfamplus sp.]